MKKLLIAVLTLTLLLACSGLAMAAGEYELTDLYVGDIPVDIEGENLFSKIDRNATEFKIIADDDRDADDVIDMKTSAGTISVRNGVGTLSLPKNSTCAIITITVSNTDKSISNEYTLALLRTSSDADPQALLAGLTINSDENLNRGTTLLKSSAFDPGILEYEFFIDEEDDIEYVYLWLEPLGRDVEVYVDGSRVKASKYDGYEVELDYDGKDQEISIEVIYDEDEDISSEYLITVAYDDTVESQESLEALLVSRRANDSANRLYLLSPKFDAEVLQYYAFLPDGDDSAFVLLTLADDDYYATYKNSEIIEESGDYFYKQLTNIKDGDSHDFVIYDEDDDKLDTYTITFCCGDEDDSDETLLEDLDVRNRISANNYEKVSLNRDFDEDITSYSATVTANSYAELRIFAEPVDGDAYVLVNNVMVNDDGYVDLPMSKGKNTVTITVIAENCEDSAEYTLTVNYGSLVSTTTLASLNVRTSVGGSLSLSPAFTSSGKGYTASVSNTVSAVALNATATADTANIYYGSTKLVSGQYSNYIALKEGINTITLTVSGEGATSSVYYLTIYRQPIKLTTVVSNQNLTVNGAAQTLYAYNINGNNFVKLRDLAALVNGTAKQFAVDFSAADNAITLTSNAPYVSNGQENVKLTKAGKVVPSSQKVNKDGLAVYPMAYNIDGNNYVMLRDMGLLFDFAVSYDAAAKAIVINTSAAYNPAD